MMHCAARRRLARAPGPLIAVAHLAPASALQSAENAFAKNDAEHGHQAALLIIDADSFLVNAAVKSFDLPAGHTGRFFTHRDRSSGDDARRFVVESDVVIIDVMGPELTTWQTAHVDPKVKRVSPFAAVAKTTPCGDAALSLTKP